MNGQQKPEQQNTTGAHQHGGIKTGTERENQQGTNSTLGNSSNNGTKSSSDEQVPQNQKGVKSK